MRAHARSRARLCCAFAVNRRARSQWLLPTSTNLSHGRVLVANPRSIYRQESGSREDKDFSYGLRRLRNQDSGVCEHFFSSFILPDSGAICFGKERSLTRAECFRFLDRLWAENQVHIPAVQMSALPALLLLLSGSCFGASHQTQFVAVGATIKLIPDQPTPERISGIVWKRDPNIVADWTRRVYRSYGRFKNRTAVDNTTGLLEISAVTVEDSGLYQVEINDALQDTAYRVQVINRVPKPTVWIRPLSCGPSSAWCDLICEGAIEGAGTVTYRWIREGEGWKESEKVLRITNDTADFRTFSCRTENGLGMEQSEPINNPFFHGEESSSSSPVAAAVCGTLLVLCLLGLGLAYWHRTGIKAYFSGRTAVAQTPPTEA